MTILTKIIFIITGIISTLVGIVGVWLPGLPTTPFILVALWAFSRSSQRLHDWLLKVPVLKVALQEAHRFEKERTLDIKVKIIAQSCAWLSFVVVSLTLQSITVSVLVGILALACSLFTFLTPTKTNASATKSNSAVTATRRA